MHWSRLSGKEKRQITEAWFITRTADRNTFPSNIPSDWPRPRQISRSEPSATPTTMRWPSASSIRALTQPHRGHGRPQIFKTEVINQIDRWKSMREVEWETLNRRTAQRNGSIGITTHRGFARTRGAYPRYLLGPIGYITPAMCARSPTHMFAPIS